MNHFLKLLDVSKEEMVDLLNLADQLKYENKHHIPHKCLEGKTLAMIFQKSSTRTRVSFETGMYQLGGHALFLTASDLQIGRGESTEDTARALSRYCDAVMIRTYAQKEVEDFAKFGTIPVINGLTDFSHPCQAMADLMTIREYKGKLEGLKLGFIGDTNNVANSLIVGCLKMGMHVTIASPKGYELDDEIAEFVKGYNQFVHTHDVMEAAKDADVLVTDAWASMGDEHEKDQRIIDFAGFQINDDVMAVAKPDAIVQHCLPAYKNEEITTKVFEEHANEIFDEAENRLHIQKAILLKLMDR